MIKGILIDLGDTVFYNTNMSLDVGAEYLYSIIPKPKPERVLFFELFSSLRKAAFSNSGLIEVSFISLLKYLEKAFNFNFKESLEEVELDFALSFSQNTLVDDIEKFLYYCEASNLKVIALSNSSFSSNTLRKQLELFNISHYFLNVLSSSENIFKKPSKFFFDIGIKEMELMKEEILFIGNDYNIDMIGGLEAGLNCAWLNKKQENVQGVFIFSAYKDLIKHLNILNKHSYNI